MMPCELAPVGLDLVRDLRERRPVVGALVRAARAACQLEARRSSRRGGPAGRCGGTSRSCAPTVPGAGRHRLPGWPTAAASSSARARRRGRRRARRASSPRACATCSTRSCGAGSSSWASRAPATACRSRWRLPANEGEVLAALPISPELRADPGAVGERSGALAAAAVEHVVEGASPGAAALERRPHAAARRAPRDARPRIPRGRPRRGGRVRARGAGRGVRGEADRPPARARPTCCPATCSRTYPTCARRSAPRTRCAWPRR